MLQLQKSLAKTPMLQLAVEDMEKLGRLDARNRDIRDLTGLQFATNATELHLYSNFSISDLSPLAGLINLELLRVDGNLSDR